MRRLWIVVAIVCGMLALASMASASMRGEVRSFVAAVAAVMPDGDVTASPSPEPSLSATESAMPSPAPSAASAEEDVDETGAQGSHGTAVSTVARDKDAVGSKTLANGKTITNHGMAVSAVARAKAGGGDGHSGGQGKGKAGH
ncbi:MAG TPA: hypothetical protein VFZ86_10575 [Thermoleophilia bacterium]|nr:hypothetical protein [Thermoleophilia bacterium]